MRALLFLLYIPARPRRARASYASRADGRMWLIGANLGYIIRIGIGSAARACMHSRDQLQEEKRSSPPVPSPSATDRKRAQAIVEEHALRCGEPRP